MTAAPNPPEPDEVRILALGDSYTIGEAVPPDARWPVQMAALLRAAGVAVADPVVIARTGWTTSELALAIDAAGPPSDFDVVTLLIGVNDQYRGHGSTAYAEAFPVLLRRAIGFARGDAARTIVLSIPDWSVTPFAEGRDRARVATEIDAFNAINRAGAARSGAHYVDVTPCSRRAALDRILLADDGLHPSALMYEEWARLVAPVVTSAIAPSHHA